MGSLLEHVLQVYPIVTCMTGILEYWNLYKGSTGLGKEQMYNGWVYCGTL